MQDFKGIGRENAAGCPAALLCPGARGVRAGTGGRRGSGGHEDAIDGKSAKEYNTIVRDAGSGTQDTARERAAFPRFGDVLKYFLNDEG